MVDHVPRRADDPGDADFTEIRRVPIWLRPWLVILNFAGAPLLFVVILVAQDAGYIPSRSRDTVAALNAHTMQASTEGAARIATDRVLAEALQQLRLEMGRNNRVVRTICADRGRDPEIRSACLWGDP